MPDPNLGALFDLLVRREMGTADAPPVDPADQDRIATAAQAQLPAWKREAIAGTNDAIEGTLGALGIGPDSRASRGGEALTALMPLASPLRSAAFRAAVHERLLAGASRLGEPVEEAVVNALEKYPRLTAHLTSVQPLSDAARKAGTDVILGDLTPHKTSLEPRARLRLDPYMQLEHGDDAPTKTVAHELTHLADLLRDADRARQAGDTGPAAARHIAAYGRYSDYDRNPYEIAARVNE